MLYSDFYSELGKLLYAVADIDGFISQKEKQALLNMVKNELAEKEEHSDMFQTNAAFYSEIEFDFDEEQITDPRSAFESFTGFIEDHYAVFDDHIKEVCLYTVKKLSEAYRNTNKIEKELIDKLEKKLEHVELKELKSRYNIR
jgi:hypothetical protein